MAEELTVGTPLDRKKAGQFEALIRPAVTRAVMAPNVLSVEADPEAAKELSAAISHAMSQDPHIVGRVDAAPAGRSAITWSAISQLINSAFLLVMTITMQLPIPAGEFIQVEPILSAIGGVGIALVPLLRKWVPNISAFFESGAPSAAAVLPGLLGVIFLLLGADPASAQDGLAGAFQRMPWLWAVPALPAAVVVGWLVSRFAGWKIGLFAFVGVLALGAWKIVIGRARKAGFEQAKRDQEEAVRRRDARAAEAGRLERERFNREGPKANDPNNRLNPNSRAGRLPDGRSDR